MSNSTQVFAFKNISSKRFEHTYAGQPISVEAGESLYLPADVADTLATHLARRILLDRADNAKLAKDEPLWSESAIERLKGEILSAAYTKQQPAELTPQEKIKRDIEELNKEIPDTIPADEIADPDKYKDKGAIIAELEVLGMPVDPRKTKTELLKILTDAREASAKGPIVSPSELKGEMV